MFQSQKYFFLFGVGGLLAIAWEALMPEAK
jgi:hypothetical protein